MPGQTQGQNQGDPWPVAHGINTVPAEAGNNPIQSTQEHIRQKMEADYWEHTRMDRIMWSEERSSL